MKNSITKILKSIVFLSSLLTIQSLAKDVFPVSGLFVEPAITYESGSSSISYPSPLSNSTGKPTGFGLGARLGFHINETFFLGADLRYGMPQFKDSSSDYNERSISSNWGPVIGIQMPDIGMRIWGTLILGGELNPEKSGNLDVKFNNETGYRVGAGFHIAMVSLNLEYQVVKYGKTTLEQLGPFLTNSSFDNVNLENKSWIASVSFPMEF